jgi:peptidoglycan/xylan/chitin deacetylase (PgdA/CDA1 family)
VKNNATYPVLLALGTTLFIYIFYFTGLLPTTPTSRFITIFKSLKEEGTASPFANLKGENYPKVPILMYHYVEYNDDERDYLRDSLNIEPHIFERQIITLKENGYTFVTPHQIYVEKQKVTKPIILSFDDGYEDFYTDVFPILKKHNAKAVSYLVVNYIGKPNYMNSEQITEISKSGLVEFGSHTMNHMWLKGQSTEFIRDDLVQSKNELERLLGKNVTSLAYPYGVYDNQVIQSASKAGYNNAVSTDQGISLTSIEAFKLKRLRPGYNVGSDLVNLLTR